MGIPNESVMQNELVEEKRREDEAVKRQRLEQSLEKSLGTLEKGLEDAIQASDPIDVAQPPPSVPDQGKK
jgi:hypothetical protein